MKLRIARKIVKAVGTPDEARYSDHQIGVAGRRLDRTRSAKDGKKFFVNLMDYLGPAGRAALFVGLKSPARALDILMRSDEQTWVNDHRFT